MLKKAKLYFLKFKLFRSLKKGNHFLFEHNLNEIKKNNFNVFQTLVNEEYKSDFVEACLYADELFGAEQHSFLFSFIKQLNQDQINTIFSLILEETEDCLLFSLFSNPEYSNTLSFLLKINFLKPDLLISINNKYSNLCCLSIKNNNLKAIQAIHNYSPNSLKFINDEGDCFFSKAALTCSEQVLFFISIHTDFNRLNLQGLTPIEKAFLNFEQELSQPNYKNNELTKLFTKNIVRANSIQNLNLHKQENFLIKVIYNAIQRKCSVSYLKALIEKLRLPLSFVHPITKMSCLELALFNNNIEVVEFFLKKHKNAFKGNFSEKYEQFPFHVNFLCSLFIFKKSELEASSFIQMNDYFIEKNWINPSARNKHGNTYLHSIAFYLGDNFNLFFPIFRNLVEKHNISPFITNTQNKTMFDLLKNEEDVLKITEHLNLYFTAIYKHKKDDPEVKILLEILENKKETAQKESLRKQASYQKLKQNAIPAKPRKRLRSV